jgi:hypothetical protein
LPPSGIKPRFFDLIPRFSAPIVVYDDGDELAESAMQRISTLNFSDASAREGGSMSHVVFNR